MKTPANPKAEIQVLSERIKQLRNDLKTLKGKDWDEQIRLINNLSVDLEMKRRQQEYKYSQKHFGDELPTYKMPK